jgi:hypothetical protein
MCSSACLLKSPGRWGRSDRTSRPGVGRGEIAVEDHIEHPDEQGLVAGQAVRARQESGLERLCLTPKPRRADHFRAIRRHRITHRIGATGVAKGVAGGIELAAIFLELRLIGKARLAQQQPDPFIVMARFDPRRLVGAHRPVTVEMLGHAPAFGIEEDVCEQINRRLGPVEERPLAGDFVPGLHGLEIMHVRIGAAVVEPEA